MTLNMNAKKAIDAWYAPASACFGVPTPVK